MRYSDIYVIIHDLQFEGVSNGTKLKHFCNGEVQNNLDNSMYSAASLK